MINEYIKYLTDGRGYSPLTAKAYEDDLRDFTRYAKTIDAGITWGRVTQGFIQSYVYTLHEAGAAAATIKRRVSALRGFYRWAMLRSLCNGNPARYVSTPKAGERLPQTLREKSVRAAMERADGTTRVIILLIVKTGLRLQELLDLDTNNFDTQTLSARVVGKGNKERTIYYDADTLQAVREYSGGRRGKLFAGLSQLDVRKAVSAAFAGTGETASPHRLRHTFATAMVESGCNVEALRQLMGHKDINTTQKYLHARATWVANEYNTHRPLRQTT